MCLIGHNVEIMRLMGKAFIDGRCLRSVDCAKDEKEFEVKKGLISLVAGAALLASSVAYAGSAPLAPGGAAGVQKAENIGGVPVYALVGGVLLVVGFIAVLTDTSKGNANSTTCGSPSSPVCTPPSTGTSST
jgi:hypothetical protein